MDVELVPEPGATVRAAVARALAATAPSHLDAPSAWWHAGLHESLEPAAAEGPRPSGYEAARSPRRTRGATRA